MSSADRDESEIRRALGWIVGALERHGVRYQAAGGLAARAHGARRPIVDIDVYLPFDEAGGLLEEVGPHVVWGPERYVGNEEVPWDLTFLKIDYGGQRIELADSSTEPRFFDRRARRWQRQEVDYGRSATAELFGVEVRVMPKETLVEYKTALGREVDVADLEQIAGR